jgi:hypothetical protein
MGLALDRGAAVQLIVEGSATIDEMTQIFVVGKTTVKAWLNKREAGLAAKVLQAERERFLRTQMLPIVEWMEENKIHNRTQAARQFGVSYHTFITWLHCRPEMDARVNALHDILPVSRRQRRRKRARSLTPEFYYVGRRVDVEIPVRKNVLHLVTKQDEHVAELKRLLAKLRQGS